MPVMHRAVMPTGQDLTLGRCEDVAGSGVALQDPCLVRRSWVGVNRPGGSRFTGDANVRRAATDGWRVGRSTVRGRADRRAGDSRWVQGGFHRVMGWVFAQWEPVAGGRLMLLATGLVVDMTAPLARPGVRGYEVLGFVTVVMTGFLLASLAVPWARMPRVATAVFPVLVWLAVGAMGEAAYGLGANYTGLFALCFAYLGLSQRTRTAVTLVPVAVACYISAYGGWTTTLTPRLVIAVAVWLLLASLIAELTARQATLVRKLRLAAQTDTLTGLGNRRSLDESVALTRVGDSIVICDLDHFKRLNDTQGHAAGDCVLAEFGAVLRACLREADHAARYGGEEFAMILPQTTANQAATMLRRLRRQWAILQPAVTFSAGVATCRPDRSANQTLAAADHALYAAKTAGRNQDCQETPTSVTSTRP